MLYLRSFTFPSQERESFNFHGARRQCYNTAYPFGVLCRFDPTVLTMDAVTILYGGNGSGKSTMLNVMADKLALTRDARYNRSTFFEEYVALCDAEVQGNLPPESRIITSDDVFDYMLNLRALNEGIDAQREDMFRQYAADRQVTQAFRTMADYDQLKRVNLARRSTQSAYVRKRIPPVSTTVSSSLPRTRHSCWPCGARASTIWMLTRSSAASGRSCPPCGRTSTFLHLTRMIFAANNPKLFADLLLQCTALFSIIM